MPQLPSLVSEVASRVQEVDRMGKCVHFQDQSALLISPAGTMGNLSPACGLCAHVWIHVCGVLAVHICTMSDVCLWYAYVCSMSYVVHACE